MHRATQPLTNGTQALAALSVMSTRNIVRLERDPDEAVKMARRLVGRVTPETMAEFVQRPEVVNAGKGMAAVGASMAVPHSIENQLAGTQALRALGESLMQRYPSIARLLSRNPNAALVAGTVAFPYAASPFFERWFKTMLGHRPTGDESERPWQPGFMATVANWNHVQPALAAVLKHHPAALVMAGPLATGLMNAGVEGIHASGVLRESTDPADDVAGDAGAGTSPTTEQTAMGKVIASQARYFMDAVRQAFKKNAHACNLATDFVTSNLYPGWVAALSSLHAQEWARRLASRNSASDEHDTGDELRALDVGAMMMSRDGRALMEHLNARPDLLAELGAPSSPE